MTDQAMFFRYVLPGSQVTRVWLQEPFGEALHFELHCNGLCGTLWADCDTPESVTALRAFRPAPAIVVRSGTLGRTHGYWPLQRPVPTSVAAKASHQLAAALASDPQVACERRYWALRPPDTINYKSDPPAPVVLVRFRPTRYTVREVVRGLATPPRWSELAMIEEEDVHDYWERVRAQTPALADQWETSGPYSGVLSDFDVPEWEPPTDPPSGEVLDYWSYDG